MNGKWLRGLAVFVLALASGCQERVVSPADVANVQLEPEILTLRVGESSQFQANLFDGAGNALTGRDVAWSVENGDIATVAENGTVIATGIGETRVIARSGGQQGMASLRVTSNTVERVEVVPAEAAVEFGSSREFEVVVTATDGTDLPDRVPVWSTSSEGIATVNDAGMVTGVGLGTTTLLADVDGVVGEATVAIVAPSLEGLRIEPATATVQVRQQRQFVAVGLREGGGEVPRLPVAWRSLDPDIATIDANGLVTAVAEGRTTIEAAFGRFIASAELDVTPIPAASIDVQPDQPSILVNDTLRLTATVLAEDGSVLDRQPAWSSSDGSVASVSESGLVTGLDDGVTYVVAALDGARDSALVRVSPRPIARIDVLPDRATLTIGETLQFAAEVIADDGSLLDRTVTWATSDGNVASVSGTGLVTARAAGDVTISATAGDVTGTASIGVEPLPIVTIEIRPSSVQLEPGGTADLEAVGIRQNGEQVTGLNVTWRTANPAVATVSGSGTVTAVAAGSTQVFAAAQGVEGSATVTVTDNRPTSIDIGGGNFSLATGQTRQLSATLRNAGGNEVDGDIAWSTKQGSIASVTGAGLVRAEAVGSTWIVASHASLRDSVQVTVGPSPIVSIVVRPSSVELQPGQTADLTAAGRRANGQEVTGLAISWSSDGDAIATVNGSGRVTAHAAGTTTVRAGYGDLEGSASVTVVAPPSNEPASIDIGGGDLTLEVGDERDLSATVRNAAGDPIDADVDWSSKNADVADVSGSGEVEAEGPGTTWIVASAGSARDSIQVTVVPESGGGQVARVDVDPGFAIIALNGERQFEATVYDDDGNVLNRPVQWSTSSSQVATVDANGLVRGRRTGAVQIRARAGGVTGTATVIVIIGS